MKRFTLVYLALAPLYLAPLVVTPFVPAFDLPHHLAIVDALMKAGRADSPYTRDFVVGLKLAPFAMHYLVLRALGEFMSVALAAKVLVAAVVLTLPLATARLLSAVDVDPLLALPAFGLAYSMPLHYGLIGFVVALPFLVWMVAEACDANAWRARPGRAAAVLAVLSLVTFFAHLEAWVVGAAAAVAALLLAPIPWRARAFGVASLAPSAAACAVFLVQTRSDPHFAGEPSFARALVADRLREFGEHEVLSDLWSRLGGLPVHLLRGFNDGADLIAARIVFGTIAAVLLVRFVAWIVRRPRSLPRPGPSAGAIAAALAAYLGLPHHLPHASSIYPRFALVVALFLLTTIPVRRSAARPRARNAIAAALFVALSIHAIDVTRHYAAFGRELADFRSTDAAAPAGRASGSLVFDAESQVMNVGGIFTGIPVYYVFDRPAPQSSTWLYYCNDPQVPCRLRDPNRVPPLPFFSYPSQFDARRALEDLDLLFVRGGPPADQIFRAELPRVRLIAEQGSWRVFARIR